MTSTRLRLRRITVSRLRETIEKYAEAYYADAVKGGGDPADIAEVEANLQYATRRLEDELHLLEARL